MTRPGKRTTEFLLTVLFVVGVFATALAGVLPPDWAAVATAAATVAYNVSRGLAKLGAGKTTPSPPAPPERP